MCGIVGYIGENNADKILINKLKKLEYRGYDSAGIATLQNGRFDIFKAEGKIQNLEKQMSYNNLSTCGIAHTRWATHGIANQTNAHPHASQNGEWACVHNGIIENFSALKNELHLSYKIKFKSDTDSEVIPNLLAVQKGKTGIEKLISVCKKLKGSYALAILNSKNKDKIFLAKNKSPLYVATLNHETFVASDPICFAGNVKEYASLNDGEFCIAEKDKLTFYNLENAVINKKFEKINFVENFSGKGSFPHFMLKEIRETPSVLKRICQVYEEENIFNKIKIDFKKINNIYLIGCGTAYHACMLGEKYIQNICRKNARAFIASEFRYSKQTINSHTLCIFVSQSGETADTLASLEIAKNKKAKLLAITNVLYSTLAQKVECSLPILAGPEIAVASTKAYSAQALILYLLANFIKYQNHKIKKNFFLTTKQFVENFSTPNENTLSHLTRKTFESKNIFFIGRNFDFVTAKESSLKLQEVSYLPCFSLPSGELKHGYIALMEKDSLVIMFATSKKLLEKTLNAAHEAKARGATIFILSQFNLPSRETSTSTFSIKLPKADELLMPIISAPYLQLFSYIVATSKGLNPDQPRNLAKSVTVE